MPANAIFVDLPEPVNTHLNFHHPYLIRGTIYRLDGERIILAEALYSRGKKIWEMTP